eukprot:COSAG05_NODE_671_length_7992_cov_30.673508_1_plen_30_part_00
MLGRYLIVIGFDFDGGALLCEQISYMNLL